MAYMCGGIHYLEQCFSTGVLQNPRVLPVISKGSAGLPVLSKNINLRLTFAVIRRFFWALSRSKMYLRSGLCSKPSCESLQCSPRPCSWWGGGSLPRAPSQERLHHSRPSASNFGPSGLRSPPKRYVFCEQSELLQKVPLHWKGWKTLTWRLWSGAVPCYYQIWDCAMPWVCLAHRGLRSQS